MDYIAAEDCIVGNCYKLESRNLLLGVYRGGGSGGSVGPRRKLGSIYLFTEYHRDLGGQMGTAVPVEDMGPCPLEDLREGWRKEVDGTTYFTTNAMLLNWLLEKEPLAE